MTARGGWTVVGKSGKPIRNQPIINKIKEKKKKVQGEKINVVDRVPLDVLIHLFSFLPCIYGFGEISPKIRETCVRWFRILTNINLLIRIWPVQSVYSRNPSYMNSPHLISCKYLNETLVAPTAGTASQLVFTYASAREIYDERYYSKTIEYEGNYYGRAFLETFKPNIWRHMRLPTSEELDNLDIHEFFNRGEIAFRYAISQISLYTMDEYQGIHSLARAFGNKAVSVEFVDWCMNQPWLFKYPSGIAEFVKYGFPLDYIERYLDIPMQCDYKERPRIRQIPIDPKKARDKTIGYIYNELTFRLFIYLDDNEHNNNERSDNKYLKDAMNRFYRLAPRKIVQTSFCDYLRHWKERKNRKPNSYQFWYEICIKNQDVHPLSDIQVPTWFWKNHKQFKEFDKRAYEEKLYKEQKRYDEKIDILRKKVLQQMEKSYNDYDHYYDYDYDDDYGFPRSERHLDLTDPYDVIEAAGRRDMYLEWSDSE